jgi:16S rRNA (adenine1518-N6/adenine1519-N6)-dimethyltransferase
MADKLTPKKSLGQNFLTSDFVPKKMCDAGEITSVDTVLEIGPGTGVLTKEILLRGAKTIAVETDERAIDILQQTFSKEINSGQLNLIKGDVRKLSLDSVGLEAGQFKVVANIPYYLSGFLFRTILDSNLQPSTLVFLIQKEVAERIARSKKQSILALSVSVFGEPKYIDTIKKGHFNPPPKVDSAILAVYNINHRRLAPNQSSHFFDILHLGFGQKRKQLLGNLSNVYKRADLETIFNALKLPQDVRAEDVDLDNWLHLVNHLPKLSTAN